MSSSWAPAGPDRSSERSSQPAVSRSWSSSEVSRAGLTRFPGTGSARRAQVHAPARVASERCNRDLYVSQSRRRNGASHAPLAVRYPATHLGGAGVHWSGAYYRWDPVEFKLRSHYTQRYGARIFEDGITAQDWPLTTTSSSPISTASIIWSAPPVRRESERGDPTGGILSSRGARGPIPTADEGPVRFSALRRRRSEARLSPVRATIALSTRPM
jgi:hypothetical protein